MSVRCKTCHYSLKNLTEHRCPECGRAFDPDDPLSFELDSVLHEHSVNRLLFWMGAVFVSLTPFYIYWRGNDSDPVVIACAIAAVCLLAYHLITQFRRSS